MPLCILHFCMWVTIKIGEGNGNPLQYSCLENPMDRGAWWAAVHGVEKSQTLLSDFSFYFHALEKEMATHSSVLAWRIPGMGEPGGLPSMGSHKVGHDWSDAAAATIKIVPWWLSDKESTCKAGDMVSIPVLGSSHGDGNGNPLWYSCLDNSVDRGAWWVTVHRVTKSQIQVMQLSTLTHALVYCIFACG